MSALRPRPRLPLAVPFPLALTVAVAGVLAAGSPAYGQEDARREQGTARLAPTDDPEFRATLARVTEHIRRVDASATELQVPEFPPEKTWFNSSPLRFAKELAGKVVLLDFWTYCCINCIHVLPDLAWLEAKYAGFPVAFVGVHSAKFENERLDASVAEAVRRYEIRHPVINDDEMRMWREIGVRSWPTLVLVGPKGNLLLMVAGEGHRELLDAAILAALEHYPPEAFNHDPVPVRPLPEAISSPLRYPGKLAIDPAGARLFISDSNHNRIVVTDLEGKFLDVIGGGAVGLRDGGFRDARFNRLQGIALQGDVLWVADAENHALRRVDLAKREVTTVAGDGTQGRDYRGGGSGREQRLSTPWDVIADGERVYIAMAGTHQIWIHEQGTGVSRVYSGTGRELNLNDADRLAAAWAQPSGLTLGDGWLFVADSESSSIRGVELASGATRTFVGGDDSEPRDLFAFGDVDGTGDEARLQHALGVIWLAKEKRVVVADTYNHRLKLLDPVERRIEAWVGSGTSGSRDGAALECEFSEPSGFALAPDGRALYVADTNNHAVRVVDLESLAVRTLALRDVPPPEPALAPRSERLADLPGTTVVRAAPLRALAGAEGRIVLSLELPEGHHYSPGAESRWQILRGTEGPLSIDESAARGVLAEGEIAGGKIGGGEIAIPYRASSEPGEGLLRLEALAYFCADGGACLVGAVVFELPLAVVAPAPGETAAPEPAVLQHRFADITGSLANPLAGTELLEGTAGGNEAEER